MIYYKHRFLQFTNQISGKLNLNIWIPFSSWIRYCLSLSKLKLCYLMPNTRSYLALKVKKLPCKNHMHLGSVQSRQKWNNAMQFNFLLDISGVACKGPNFLVCHFWACTLFKNCISFWGENEKCRTDLLFNP